MLVRRAGFGRSVVVEAEEDGVRLVTDFKIPDTERNVIRTKVGGASGKDKLVLVFGDGSESRRGC